ncbi:MAG TPA: DUF2007 domain-containing protein [Thermoanaerobaculia bacterium]|jgi:hypothetical protein|nr:DUF2007 domain-containing protein [Thermoanaerobaculia bacterium]
MVCPECGSEYREGFTKCSDCDVALVEPVPEEGGEPDVEIVKVFESTNAATLPLVESVLLDANIEFLTKGEGLQNLFEGSNSAIGPATIWVRKDDEAEARGLIDMLDEPVTPQQEE